MPPVSSGCVRGRSSPVPRCGAGRPFVAAGTAGRTRGPCLHRSGRRPRRPTGLVGDGRGGAVGVAGGPPGLAGAVGVTCPPRPRADDLEGWTPIRVEWRDGAPWVDWCHTTGIEFNDPFFDQTVERCLRHPYRLAFRRLTPIECLAPPPPAVRPDGFV